MEIEMDELRELLSRLPYSCPGERKQWEDFDLDNRRRAELWNYAFEHGLAQGRLSRGSKGWKAVYKGITAKGIDFLRADGGVFAYMNKVTLSPEQFALLLDVLQATGHISKEKNSWLKKALSKFGDAQLAALATRLTQNLEQAVRDILGNTPLS